MNLAQMEGFQWMLERINNIVDLYDLDVPKYQLVFSYNDQLFTANFYKSENTLLDRVEYLSEEVDGETSFHSFKPSGLKSNQLLFQLINGRFDEFHQTYVGKTNLQHPEIMFSIIKKFVSSLDGDPVSNFIYDLKSYTSNLEMPFLEPDKQDKLTPLFLASSTELRN